MKKSTLSQLYIGMLIIILGCIIGFLYGNFNYEKIKHSVLTPFTSDKRPERNILFIGNSYTFGGGNIPAKIKELVSPTSNCPYAYYIKSITKGAARLKDHWHNPKVQETIKNEDWDIIVLQGASYAALTHPQEFKQYAQRFIQHAKNHSAQPLLYVTWARQKGARFYNSYPQLQGNPEEMQRRITDLYYSTGKNNQSGFVMAGPLFSHVAAHSIDKNLYESDGSHPSNTGGWLVALSFHTYLCGMDISPDHIKQALPSTHHDWFNTIYPYLVKYAKYNW